MKYILLSIILLSGCVADKQYYFSKRGSVAENGDVPKRLITYKKH